ncbi:MAG: UDP-N-acetylmuramoyl-L-alanine--D-glutamate ligase [Candidatus Kapaibacterium sp.]
MKVVIAGAARSGLAAAKLAKSESYDVFLTELKNEDKSSEVKKTLIEHDIPHEFGGHSYSKLSGADYLVVSPGIPPTAEIIKEAENQKIKIISEIEFAWMHCNNPIIAITGTNGKTTTTALTAYIINNSGRKAVATGNIGLPMSSVVKGLKKDEIVVAELSSYQLDRIIDFRPDVAVILNITPDHLSYHGSMESYINAKFKISANQNEKNLLILNHDDEISSRGEIKSNVELAYFSMSSAVRGIYNDRGRMMINFRQHKVAEEIMLFNELALPGVHNAYNSMAAALAARALEVRNENIRDSLRTFKGVEHRLEFVRSISGIDFINDSKATNINATWFALSSYDRPVIWLAGGRGDNNDYSQLDKVVGENVKAIVSIGEESENIFNYFCTKKRCVQEQTLESAVKAAYELADLGDIVLFTPACKSFDMFMNFEQRGEYFKEIVNSL